VQVPPPLQRCGRLWTVHPRGPANARAVLDQWVLTKMWPLPRELLWAIIISLGLFVVLLWPNADQLNYKGQRVEQHSATEIESQSSPQDHHARDDTSEITVLGIRLGEWFLGIAAWMLWYATARLVTGSDDAAKRQLRAYVSGGGSRALSVRESAPGGTFHPDAWATPIENGRWRVFEPIGSFTIQINNHGHTPAYTRFVEYGFFDAAAGVPDDPPYRQHRFVHTDAIGPQNQSKHVRTVEYPAGRWARVAICGRIYWTDVLDREWSNGFVYEIASGNAAQNDSISIEAPRVYWEERRERDRQ
jgi:hypothetical protein